MDQKVEQFENLSSRRQKGRYDVENLVDRPSFITPLRFTGKHETANQSNNQVLSGDKQPQQESQPPTSSSSVSTLRR